MRRIFFWLALALVILFPFKTIYPLLLLLALCLVTFLAGLSELITGAANRKFDAAIVPALLLVAAPEASHILGMRVAYLSFLIGFLSLLFLPLLLGSAKKKSAVGAFSSSRRGSQVLWSFAMILLFAVAVFIPIAGAIMGSGMTRWFALIIGLAILVSNTVQNVKKYLLEFLLQFRELFVHRATFLLGVSGLLVVQYTFVMIASIRLSTFSYLGIAVLSVLPAYIWYKIFRVREDHIHLPDWPGWLTSIVIASIAPMLIAFPLRFLAGPVVLTSRTDSVLYLAVFLGIFILSLLVSMIDEYVRRALMLIPFIAAVLMMGVYAYYAFIGLFFEFMILAFTLNGWMASLLPALLFLFMLQSLFYVAGYLSLLYEMWRE